MNNKTLLLDHGSHICVNAYSDKDRLEALRPAVYEIVLTDTGVKLFTLQDKFLVAERKFGDHNEFRKVLTEDYDRVGPSVGAILIGVKGSGKTMLAEDVCNHYLKLGLPVFRVNTILPLAVLELVSAAAGPAVWYFDEFGKVYREDKDKNNRDDLLGFFGSASRLGSLYLVTANRDEELSNFMVHRPGRFRYSFTFQTPTGEQLNEVFNHFMVAEDLRPMLRAWVSQNEASYDVLCSILPTIRGCKTREEVYNKARIFNIPTFPSYGVSHLTSLESAYMDRDAIDFSPRGTPIVSYIYSEETREVAYRIRVKVKTEDGEQLRTEMRRVKLDDLEQYLVPADFNTGAEYGTVRYEFPDESGLMLTMTLSWSARNYAHSGESHRHALEHMERTQAMNEGKVQPAEAPGPRGTGTYSERPGRTFAQHGGQGW
jgi:hypothetical protein